MDWQDGGDGFDLQDKLVGDEDIRLEAVTELVRPGLTSGLTRGMGMATCRTKAMPTSRNSWHRHCSYTDSNRPGPVWRCTSIANPITRSVNGSASSIAFSP